MRLTWIELVCILAIAMVALTMQSDDRTARLSATQPLVTTLTTKDLLVADLHERTAGNADEE